MFILGIMESQSAAAVGDFESIATTTVGAGGTSSVSFSSISSSYQHLQIRAFIRGSNYSFPNMTFNSDTGSNYAYHQLYGTGTAVGAAAAANNTKIYFTDFANDANNFNAVVCDILDYKDTNKFKTARILGGYDTNGGGIMIMTSGLWRSTSAITTITFAPNAGTFAQYSHFALYGIKG